jgi:hypothetical protein
MNIYDNNLKVTDALQLYFSRFEFENGGYYKKWFTIKVGFIRIPFPNIKARIDAVKFHDLHHLVTEYEANLKGEAQISGWEIASGCSKYYMAWILNSGSFFYGMFIVPRALYHGFMRGRKAKTNFYYNTRYDDILLNKTVGELRQTSEPDHEKNNSMIDYFLFAFCCVCGFTLAFITVFCLYRLGKWVFSIN